MGDERQQEGELVKDKRRRRRHLTHDGRLALVPPAELCVGGVLSVQHPAPHQHRQPAQEQVLHPHKGDASLSPRERQQQWTPSDDFTFKHWKEKVACPTGSTRADYRFRRSLDVIDEMAGLVVRGFWLKVTTSRLLTLGLQFIEIQSKDLTKSFDLTSYFDWISLSLNPMTTVYLEAPLSLIPQTLPAP